MRSWNAHEKCQNLIRWLLFENKHVLSWAKKCSRLTDWYQLFFEIISINLKINQLFFIIFSYATMYACPAGQARTQDHLRNVFDDDSDLYWDMGHVCWWCANKISSTVQKNELNSNHFHLNPLLVCIVAVVPATVKTNRSTATPTCENLCFR